MAGIRGAVLDDMNRDVVRRLQALRQLDHDVIHAYERAIERVDIITIRIALDAFRRDHERDVFELSRVLVDDGEPHREPRRRWKGVVHEVRTVLQSATGTRGALEALHRTESRTHLAIDELLDEDLPPGVRAMLERDRADEARHLAFLERALQLLDDDTEGPERWTRLSTS
jgi:hypothetical protein